MQDGFPQRVAHLFGRVLTAAPTERAALLEAHREREPDVVRRVEWMLADRESEMPTRVVNAPPSGRPLNGHTFWACALARIAHERVFVAECARIPVIDQRTSCEFRYRAQSGLASVLTLLPGQGDQHDVGQLLGPGLAEHVHGLGRGVLRVRAQV